ncbi:MAG: hypothetical protein ACK4RK_17045 [Gemmataceae bacterium]
MLRCLFGAVVMSLLLPSVRADEPYTVKTETKAPPSELKEPFRDLLSDRVLLVADDKGKPLCEIWLRKNLEVAKPLPATETSLRYTQVEPTTFIGAIRFTQMWSDFRRQKIKPGVYTLRMASQPMDGDHMGTAPYNEFLLLVPAAREKTPAVMDPEDLFDLSSGATGRSHPGILLLFPNPKAMEAPDLASRPGNIMLLLTKMDATAAGQKTALGLGMTLFGATMAE